MVRQPARPVVFSALAYCAIGVASAVFSNPVEDPDIQALMRLIALALGVLVYTSHVRYEVVRLGNAPGRCAFRTAGAVALGVFLLAVYAVLYNVLVRSRSFASVALLLIVWPLVTGALGFVGAVGLARVVLWWRRRRDAP